MHVCVFLLHLLIVFDGLLADLDPEKKGAHFRNNWSADLQHEADALMERVVCSIFMQNILVC